MKTVTATGKINVINNKCGSSSHDGEPTLACIYIVSIAVITPGIRGMLCFLDSLITYCNMVLIKSDKRSEMDIEHDITDYFHDVCGF